MGYQVNVEQEEERARKHIHEGVVGRVFFPIYRNVNLKGEFLDFKFKLFRREGSGPKHWRATSYFHEDMSDVAKAATSSYIWLRDNTNDYEIRPFADAVARVIPVAETLWVDEDPPVYEVQFGNVRASVWEKTSPKTGKLYYKFSFRRLEPVGEDVLTWNNFRPEDSRHLSQAATHCHIWHRKHVGNVQRPAVAEEVEKKQPAKRKPRRAAK